LAHPPYSVKELIMAWGQRAASNPPPLPSTPGSAGNSAPVAGAAGPKGNKATYRFEGGRLYKVVAEPVVDGGEGDGGDGGKQELEVVLPAEAEAGGNVYSAGKLLAAM